MSVSSIVYHLFSSFSRWKLHDCYLWSPYYVIVHWKSLLLLPLCKLVPVDQPALPSCALFSALWSPPFIPLSISLRSTIFRFHMSETMWYFSFCSWLYFHLAWWFWPLKFWKAQVYLFFRMFLNFDCSLLVLRFK
jgi:hypothetical protein